MQITRVTIRQQETSDEGDQVGTSVTLALIICEETETIVINDNGFQAFPEDLDELDLAIRSIGEIAQRVKDE